VRIELGEDQEPEIGLVALIDCIFFLLMFFMVATSFKQHEENRKNRALPVDLPKSQATLRAEDASNPGMVITVDRDGQVFVDGNGVSHQALHDRLRALAARDRTASIRIDGDRRADFQSVVRVMDLCAFEGLTNLAVHVRE
jgi:biopolymer transport protein ExbD